MLNMTAKRNIFAAVEAEVKPNEKSMEADFNHLITFQ